MRVIPTEHPWAASEGTGIIRDQATASSGLMAKSVHSRTDEELCALIRKGGEHAREAFEEIYVRHGSRVYTYCRRMLNNEVVAEDMFQETFIRLYNNRMQDDRPMQNAAAYILRIARNLCLNEQRRKHNSTVPFEEVQFPVYNDSYESSELLQLIETAMEMLPEEYREVLVLKEHLDLSYNEIAEITGTNMPVIRTRIYRAKGRLRGILAPYLEDLQK